MTAELTELLARHMEAAERCYQGNQPQPVVKGDDYYQDRLSALTPDDIRELVQHCNQSGFRASIGPDALSHRRSLRLTHRGNPPDTREGIPAQRGARRDSRTRT